MSSFVKLADVDGNAAAADVVVSGPDSLEAARACKGERVALALRPLGGRFPQVPDGFDPTVGIRVGVLFELGAQEIVEPHEPTRRSRLDLERRHSTPSDVGRTFSCASRRVERPALPRARAHRLLLPAPARCR